MNFFSITVILIVADIATDPIHALAKTGVALASLVGLLITKGAKPCGL